MEKIICAAVRFQGKVWRGNRHNHALEAMYDELSYVMNRQQMNQQQTDRDQGFITSENRFVDRQEAFAIAHTADQLLKLSVVPTGTLYSEDLY